MMLSTFTVSMSLSWLSYCINTSILKIITTG